MSFFKIVSNSMLNFDTHNFLKSEMFLIKNTYQVVLFVTSTEHTWRSNDPLTSVVCLIWFCLICAVSSHAPCMQWSKLIMTAACIVQAQQLSYFYFLHFIDFMTLEDVVVYWLFSRASCSHFCILITSLFLVGCSSR